MFPALALAAVLGRNSVYVCGVVDEAERRALDPVVVVALVEHESNFRPWACSRTADFGLMQIHAPLHGRYPDTRAHIAKGVDILAGELARERGDMRRALSRYNTGKVRRRGLAYADRVLSIAAGLRRKLGGVRTWSTRASSSRLSRSDCWYGLWWPDYDPRKRRGANRKTPTGKRALPVVDEMPPMVGGDTVRFVRRFLWTGSVCRQEPAFDLSTLRDPSAFPSGGTIPPLFSGAA